MAASLSLVLGIVGWLAFFCGPAVAQQFSADIFTIGATGQPTGTAGKLYVSDAAVRFETPALPDGVFLLNAKAGTSYLVRPAQQIWMDAKQSSPLTQILVPVDPDAPCRQWQAMAIVAGAAGQGKEWHCHRLGAKSLDGRRVVEYEATSLQGQTDYAWIDPQLKFPVMFQYQDGTKIKLDGIRKGPQPVALFEIPAGFDKLDPRKLIEQVKESDVWVQPPK
jgi:hypothetical protein